MKMTGQIRWGILSTGKIAHEFATGLRSVCDAQLLAVGSRTQHAADAFGKVFNVPHCHAGYEALAHDPDVDVIFVATPHSMHKAHSLLCLEAGKAVLCEKSFTVNALEAAEVIQTAREKRLFLMEAMWTRFIPAFARVRELLTEGIIGDLLMLVADCGIRAPFNAHSPLYNPDLGGSALLDVGVYGVSLASALFGSPECINSMACLGATGIDEQSTIQFGYRGGQIAVLSCSISARTRKEAMIVGTEGYIVIRTPWWHPQTFTLSITKRPDKIYEIPFESNGFNYEATEVMRCLADGQLESEVMPLDETLSIMRTMDQVRAQWGLVYPSESTPSGRNGATFQESRSISSFAQGTTMIKSRDAMRSFAPLANPPERCDARG
jgi:predicted dehydrogenase